MTLIWAWVYYDSIGTVDINSRKINTKFYQLNMSGLIGGRFILIVKTENKRIRRDVIKLQSATEFTFLANTYFYSYFVFLNNIHE